MDVPPRSIPLRVKNLLWGLVMLGWILGSVGVGLSQSAGSGTVAGTIAVYKTKVKTDGAKSFEDVVVYLEPQTPASYPPPEKHTVMDQRGLVFIPHVMAIQKGTTVDFLNSDHDRHNVYFLYDETGDTLDIGTWGPGQTVSHTFTQTGLVITLCQLHLEMAAHILVLEYPFFSVAEIDGETQQAAYAIDMVPTGDYVLRAWHKKLRLKSGDVSVSVAAGQTTTVHLVITRAKHAD